MMTDLSDLDEIVSGIETKFNTAAEFLEKNVDKIEQSHLLELYGLYKQATVGKCNTPKPGLFNLQGKAKWNAWNKLGDLSKDRSMENYINLLVKIFPTQDFSEASNTKKLGQNKVSTLIPSDIVEQDSTDKNIFDLVKEGAIEKLLAILECPSNTGINSLDESGLGLIHWASDRGNPEVVKILLENHADIHLKDHDGQTALHYASSCGNELCVKILLANGADPSVVDSEDSTCFDVAFDEHILSILKMNLI